MPDIQGFNILDLVHQTHCSIIGTMGRSVQMSHHHPYVLDIAQPSSDRIVPFTCAKPIL